MFEGFIETDVDVADDVRIHLRHGGNGPPLLLLHGNPLTHVSWHAAAARLAEHFTVVAPDLRGYGDSTAPEPDPEHAGHSFRAMAQDQIAVMDRLGHGQFAVAGHDRGGRVVHRLCLDSPQRVSRAAVLDIVPTEHMFTHTSREWVLRYWHWSFMAHEADLPERMMGAVPARYYMEHKLGRAAGRGDFFADEAFDEYVRCFDESTIRASCEDYRAAATYDLALDTADLHRRIAVPLLVLWGSRSNVQHLFADPVEIWRARAEDVRGHALDTGHYVNEEAPDAVVDAFLTFFADVPPGSEPASRSSC